jgi:hypothetical protein
MRSRLPPRPPDGSVHDRRARSAGEAWYLAEVTRALARCAHCGNQLRPRKVGHVFCSVGCRHRGERTPHDPPPVDPELVERLFDPGRDPNGRVRDDDWFAPADASPEVGRCMRGRRWSGGGAGT